MLPGFVKSLTRASILVCLVLLLAACGGSAAAPTLKIVSPTDGATVKGPKVKVEVEATGWKLIPAGGAVTEGEGHLHFFVDKPASSIPVGQPIPATDADPAFVHAGKEPLTSRELQLSPGKHTITVVMGNSAHIALNSPAPQSITVNVE